MPYSNDPAAWQNFYLKMGTANAAITGLVFVALSIHLREVLDHPILKPRAVLALVVLTTQIVIAAIVLTPQSREFMGAEILILNGIFLALNVRNRVETTLNQAALASLLIRGAYVYASVSLIVGVGGGYYVLGLVLVLTLARTMVSCWALLTALGRWRQRPESFSAASRQRRRRRKYHAPTTMTTMTATAIAASRPENVTPMIVTASIETSTVPASGDSFPNRRLDPPSVGADTRI